MVVVRNARPTQCHVTASTAQPPAQRSPTPDPPPGGFESPAGTGSSKAGPLSQRVSRAKCPPRRLLISNFHHRRCPFPKSYHQLGHFSRPRTARTAFFLSFHLSARSSYTLSDLRISFRSSSSCAFPAMSSRYKDKDSGVVLTFNGQWVSWSHTIVAYSMRPGILSRSFPTFQVLERLSSV